ncbi:ATP-binding protein, partial [Delftia tsuruhatensis]
QGPGIPPQELDKIFQPFVQSSKTRNGSGGTGLGLAICRKIIDAMDGTIVASNRPEGGSLFRITLPCRSASETRPAELL